MKQSVPALTTTKYSRQLIVLYTVQTGHRKLGVQRDQGWALMISICICEQLWTDLEPN